MTKIQEVAIYYGYLKNISMPSFKNSIFGNVAKMACLHEVLWRVPKLWENTVIVLCLNSYQQFFVFVYFKMDPKGGTTLTKAI